jgi:hypothetical protein
MRIISIIILSLGLLTGGADPAPDERPPEELLDLLDDLDLLEEYGELLDAETPAPDEPAPAPQAAPTVDEKQKPPAGVPGDRDGTP